MDAQLSLWAIQPVDGYITECVKHGQCDARPTVVGNLPATVVQ